MTEYIDITPTSRLSIDEELSPTCPRGDWHMLTGFVKIPGAGDSRLQDVPAVYDPPIPIEDVHDHFDHTATGPVPTEDITARWARIFHGLHLDYDSEHGGYWFVAGADFETATTPVDGASRALFYDNWPDLVVGSPEHLAKQAEVIRQEQEVYRQWAEGEVYIVALQRATTLAPVEWNAGDEAWELASPLTEDMLETAWEEVESICGNYLDDDYTAQQVALEHFDLSDDEVFALAPKPEVGDRALYRRGHLDSRPVAEVSEDGRRVRLDIMGYVTNWVPSSDYRFIKAASA